MSDEEETISLKDGHYYFVFDKTGECVEIYMPDNGPDAIVPENIVKVVKMVSGEKDERDEIIEAHKQQILKLLDLLEKANVRF